MVMVGNSDVRFGKKNGRKPTPKKWVFLLDEKVESGEETCFD